MKKNYTILWKIFFFLYFHEDAPTPQYTSLYDFRQDCLLLENHIVFEERTGRDALFNTSNNEATDWCDALGSECKRQSPTLNTGALN